MATSSKATDKTKKAKEKQLTWPQKLDQGVPLNRLDEVKADADFNYHQRLREQQARENFEKLKNRGRLAEDVDRLNAEDAAAAEDDSANDGEDK